MECILARDHHGAGARYEDSIGEKMGAPRFSWNPSVEECEDAVVCLDLPLPDPVQALRMYANAGVPPFRIVFVGDPLSMTDDEYYRITSKGALVHDARKEGAYRQKTEDDLFQYFSSPSVAVLPEKNPNPYTYEPGPPKVTPEQLQAFIDAIAKRR
jgi:hypothetical protein